jgi:hypothetical protein
MKESVELASLTEQLRAVNRELWQTEEKLRLCERNRTFGVRFVKLARTVYTANDRRAALKRCIDVLVGSEIREHKYYESLPEREQNP